MKALLLNSGTGSRMGEYTKSNPKTMVHITANDTIISRQVRQLLNEGIKEIVVTTGPFEDMLKEYLYHNFKTSRFTFVKNSIYNETNYIYSIYLARELLDDDIVLIHGDLVFEDAVLHDILKAKTSVVAVSSTLPLPEKDFKGVMLNKRIDKIGVEFFDNALTLQPLYKINRNEWKIWLNEIIEYCNHNNTKCYAEKAFNEVSKKINLVGLDFKDKICFEIDNEEDLMKIKKVLGE